jgi:phosphatidate cytidylyltransferase
MLKHRIITAILLLSVLIPIIVSPNILWFQLLTIILVAVASWEWGQLSKLSLPESIVFSIFMFFVVFSSQYFEFHYFDFLTYFSFLFWIIGVFIVLKVGTVVWKKIPKIYILVLGFIILFSLSMHFISARKIGINYLLSVLSIVWVSDIAAYFGGKAFGRKKLAPNISPGKSWEGVFIGMLMVLVCGFCWILFDQNNSVDSNSFYTYIFNFSPIIYFPFLLFITGVGVAGDLFESMMKRSIGVKDSSHLLPGHGGVLDRIDALIPVLTVAMIAQKILL